MVAVVYPWLPQLPNDESSDDSGPLTYAALQPKNASIMPGHGSGPLLAVGGLREPKAQDHLAADQSASRLIWEQIWEQTR